MTLLLFTPVISIWKVSPGARRLPVQKAQTHPSPGGLHPVPAPCPRPPHSHRSSAHSRLLAFAAPGLSFCREVRASSRAFRQLSASRARTISPFCSTHKGSPFLLYLPKIKPEEVTQSNSNRLSRLQPNGHN